MCLCNMSMNIIRNLAEIVPTLIVTNATLAFL